MDRKQSRRRVKRHPTCILFVCGGNTCRSPMAAGLAGKMLGRVARVESAGIDAGGQKATPEAILVMRECGIDIFGHQARDISSVPLNSYDHSHKRFHTRLVHSEPSPRLTFSNGTKPNGFASNVPKARQGVGQSKLHGMVMFATYSAGEIVFGPHLVPCWTALLDAFFTASPLGWLYEGAEGVESFVGKYPCNPANAGRVGWGHKPFGRPDLGLRRLTLEW